MRPEVLLEKLREYEELEKRESELNKLILDMKDEVRQIVRSELSRYVDDVRVVRELADVITDLVIEDRILDPMHLRYVLPHEAARECDVKDTVTTAERLPPKFFEAVVKSVRPYIDKVRELEQELEETRRKRRDIFGVIEGDYITVESIVTLIYKCLKYVLETN